MSKIHIAIIKNPFQPSDVIRKQVLHIPGQPVFSYIQPELMLPIEEIEVLCGGKVLSTQEIQSAIIGPDEYVIVIPKVAGSGDTGKDILMVVASIGLMMLTMGVGNIASGMAWGSTTGMAGWTFWGYAAAIGTQVAGGMLLNHLFPAPKPDLPDMSPTYGWNGIQPLIGQGQPVPITLGTVRTAGQVVSEYVSTDGEKQYYNMLIEAGEGPCDYIGTGEDADCTGIENIKINGNPLENYTSIRVYKRAGLNDQSVIPTFNDTRTDQIVNTELKVDGVKHTYTTSGSNIQALEVALFFPNGLYRQGTSGRYTATVRVAIEYKKHSEETWQLYSVPQTLKIAPWIDLVNKNRFFVKGDATGLFPIGTAIKVYDNGIPKDAVVTNVIYDYETDLGYITQVFLNIDITKTTNRADVTAEYAEISGVYSKAFSRNIRIDNLDPDQYDIRLECVHNSDGSVLYWAKYTQILYDDFARPNKTLLAITALASEQISGQRPLVTFELTRSTVWVWVPDDPILDPWGPGAYQEKPANNPAWAAYWMYHRVYKIYNINTGSWEFVVRGVAANRMLYSEFSEWADFCTTRGLEVNIRFDTIQKLREAVKHIEELGRGRVIPRGTRIGCIWDAPATKDALGNIIPVQVFNVSNIGLDSFSEQFVDISERATAIEVTFFNRLKDHERDVVLVPADGLNPGEVAGNVTQITLFGCTSYEQAWKEGKYRLRLNRYLNCTVNISSDVNAIVSNLGQVIFVQHDVPQWGYGGRVVSATTNTITFDKPVPMEAGATYKVMVSLSNDTTIEKTVITEAGEVETITVTEPFENDTHAAVYVDPTHFQVDGDQTAIYTVGLFLQLFHATGDQFDAVVGAVYNAGTGKTVVEVTSCPTTITEARFAWTMPRKGDQWIFGPEQSGVKKHSRPFKVLGFTRESNLRYRLTGINYVDEIYTEAADVPAVTYTLIEPLVEVTGLNVIEETFRQKDGTIISRLSCSWVPAAKPVDAYQVFYSRDNGITWVYNGQTIAEASIIENVVTGETYLVKVCAVKAPITSDGAVSIPVTVTGKDTPPGAIKSLNVVQQGGIIKVSVTPPDDPDIRNYELRMGPTWENSALVKVFNDVQTTVDITQEGTQTFWVKACDNSGNYSDTATKAIITIFGSPSKNIIFERTENISNWVTTGMFRTNGCLKIDSQEQIGDFTYFADIFNCDYHLREDAEIVLPVIDLGTNVFEENYFYYDPWGYQQLKTVETLGDYDPDVFTIFEGAEWTSVTPQYKVQAFLNVDIDFEKSPNNFVNVEYRLSFDGQSWGSWIPLIDHQFFGRYIQLRFIPGSLDAKTNVCIRGATIKIDVPDIEEKIPWLDIASTGATRHYFQQRFYGVPTPPDIFSYDAAGKQCTHEIVGGRAVQGEDGIWYIDIRLWDGATQIAGKIHGIQRGY